MVWRESARGEGVPDPFFALLWSFRNAFCITSHAPSYNFQTLINGQTRLNKGTRFRGCSHSWIKVQERGTTPQTVTVHFLAFIRHVSQFYLDNILSWPIIGGQSGRRATKVGGGSYSSIDYPTFSVWAVKVGPSHKHSLAFRPFSIFSGFPYHFECKHTAQYALHWRT